MIVSRPALHIENMRHKVISEAKPFTAKLAYITVKAAFANAGLTYMLTSRGGYCTQSDMNFVVA